MRKKVDDFEIECHTKFSWDYIYSIGGRRKALWADSLEYLKMKVLANNLPWDDGKVPKAKPIKVVTRVSFRESEESPAQFRLPWCKSNYKRY